MCDAETKHVVILIELFDLCFLYTEVHITQDVSKLLSKHLFLTMAAHNTIANAFIYTQICIISSHLRTLNRSQRITSQLGINIPPTQIIDNNNIMSLIT